MAQPDKAVKAMSSRLANMKFMQRASASSASSSPRTPAEPAAKRQRLSNGSSLASPATPGSQLDVVTQESPQEDEDSSERKRKYPSHYAESRWYLKIKEKPSPAAQPALRIVSAGYSAIDSSVPAWDPSAEEEEEIREQTSTPTVSGRRSFGKFNRSIEKQQDPNANDSESESDPSDEEDENEDGEISDDPTGAKAMIAQSRKAASDRARAERKAKRKSDVAESARLAEDRRKKQVNLNRLTSISGGGGSNTPSRQNSLRDVICHKCGEKGHMIKDCPRWATSRLRRDP